VSKWESWDIATRPPQPPLAKGGSGSYLKPRVSSLKPAALFFDNLHLRFSAWARRAEDVPRFQAADVRKSV
jgi:hypothetical protein